MHPILFHLGSHPVHTYGVAFSASILLVTFLGLRRAEHDGVDGVVYLRAILAALIGMVLMSKLLHVITAWPEYAANPRRLLSWTTGHVFYGGYIGSILFPWVYIRLARRPFLPILDPTATYMPLGLALHRAFGCMNAGCCFGRPTDAPWAVHFPPDSLAAELYGAAAVHPTQYYEALFGLLMFAIIIYWRRYHQRVAGELIALQIALYAVGRIVIEVFRGDADRGHFGALSSSQWISLLMLAADAILVAYLIRERRRLDAAR